MVKAIVLLAILMLAIAWSAWAITYRIHVPEYRQSKFMRLFGLSGLFVGGIAAGNVLSQLIKILVTLP